jgi:hypothetical protein
VAVGAEGLVAGGRLVGVEHGGDLAGLDGEMVPRKEIGLALGLVGVEQRGRGDATKRKIELPRQVGDVADAEPHALPWNGGMVWAASPARKTRPWLHCHSRR